MIDRRLLVHAVKETKKPTCTFSIQTPYLPRLCCYEQEAFALAQALNLEVLTWRDSDGWMTACVGVASQRAAEILKDAPKFFAEFPLSTLPLLIDDLTGLSPAHAVAVLERGHKTPEAAACLGLLFGFPVCCIHYFLNTRHFGAEWEQRTFTDVGYVQCEDCFRKNRKPPWFS